MTEEEKNDKLEKKCFDFFFFFLLFSVVLILILPFFVVRFLLFLFTECTGPSSRHAHRTYTPLDPLPPLPLLLCFLHLVSSRAINFTIPCCAFIKCLFKVLILYVWGLCIVYCTVSVCVLKERMNGCDQSVPVCAV